jgi:hypothetical protein
MMFTENPWPPMLIAGLAALVFVALWNKDRNSRFLGGAVFCVLLIAGFFLFERAYVTQGEQLQADVALLCDQFRHRQPETLTHFSESAADFRELCNKAMNMVEIDNDLRLTDFHTTFTNNNSRANVHFRANATISAMGFKGHHPLRCILTYQKEGGTWKIVDVQRLDPIKGDRMEIMAAK